MSISYFPVFFLRPKGSVNITLSVGLSPAFEEVLSKKLVFIFLIKTNSLNLYHLKTTMYNVKIMQTYTHHSQKSTPITIVLPAYLRKLKKHFFDFLILGLFIHLVFQKDITIQFQLQDRAIGDTELSTDLVPTPKATVQVMPVALKKATPKIAVKDPKQDRRANNFSNMTFILNPTYAKRKGIANVIVAEKLENCLDYVRRYVGVAQKEMREYGIPASITLAQGLLESNAGDSRLSRESNNHFGIKCRSKCRGCTCRNYTDDDIYDMFRVFEQPLESYQEHSKLLTSKRYKHLLRLGRKNYQAWAYGLKKAGYATDKRYAEKLIQIIEELELDRYDS